MRTSKTYLLAKIAVIAFVSIGFYKTWKHTFNRKPIQVHPTMSKSGRTDFGRVIAEINAPKLISDVEVQRPLTKFLLLPNVISYSTWKTSNKSIRWTAVNAVKSAPANIDRRNAIRQTWGSIKFLDGVRFETVFVIGQTDDDVMQVNIRKEHEKFGDIVQIDVPDTKQNVPLKTLASLQWAGENLIKEWIFSSADDDMVLHPANFVLYVDKIIVSSSKETGRNIADFPEYDVTNLPIMCVYSYQPHDPPARDPKSKWYMPIDLYPPEAWPPYCRGGWYTMTVSVAASLHKISRKTKYLHLDDVWITGIMRMKMLAGDSADKYLLKKGIVTAPLASRDDKSLINHVGEDRLNEVIVSHMWGDIKDIDVDVLQSLTELWNKWEPSVMDKQNEDED